MKKILFAVAAMFAISFVSCGNRTSNASNADTDSIAVDSVLTDSVAVDSTTCTL